MDAVSTLEMVPVEMIPADEPEQPRAQRRRESGYARMKRRALIAEKQKREISDQSREISALEALAHRLLNHLTTAVSSDLTPAQRQGYLNLVNDVRSNLSE